MSVWPNPMSCKLSTPDSIIGIKRKPQNKKPENLLLFARSTSYQYQCARFAGWSSPWQRPTPHEEGVLCCIHYRNSMIDLGCKKCSRNSLVLYRAQVLIPWWWRLPVATWHGGNWIGSASATSRRNMVADSGAVNTKHQPTVQSWIPSAWTNCTRCGNCLISNRCNSSDERKYNTEVVSLWYFLISYKK